MQPNAKPNLPNKDDVCFCHMLLDFCGEEQVTSNSLLHHSLQTRFEDGQGVTVPCSYARLVDVHHNHLNVLQEHDQRFWRVVVQ